MVLRVGGFTLTADNLSCSQTPRFKVTGRSDLLNWDTERIQEIANEAGTSVRKRCPAISEIILQGNRSERLLKLGSIATSPGVSSGARATETPPSSGKAPLQPELSMPNATPGDSAPGFTIPALPFSVSGPGRLPSSAVQKRRRTSAPEDLVGPYCPSIEAWRKLVVSELPPTARIAIAPNHPDFDRLTKVFAVVLSDEAFVPVFGKPYDQLSDSERNLIVDDVVEPCFRRGGEWDPRISLQSLFYSCAGYAGCVSKPDYRKLVAWRRELRRELPSLMSQVVRTTEQPDGYLRLSDVSHDMVSRLDLLLPSESKGIVDQLGNIRSVAADRYLASHLQPLIDGASESGAVSLAQKVATDFRVPLREATAPARIRYQEQIAAKVSKGAALAGHTPAPFEFSFSTDPVPQLMLINARSSVLSARLIADLHEATQTAFPEIHTEYKRTDRTWFLKDGDFDIRTFSEDRHGGGEQRIRVCRYASPKAVRDYFFWDFIAPNAARPPRLKAADPLHPFLMIGRPLDQCPTDARQAAAIVRENFRVGTDYPEGHLPALEPLLLPEYLSATRANWKSWTDALADSDSFAGGVPYSLPFPRRADLSSLGAAERQQVMARAHDFKAEYWARLAFSNQAAYFTALRAYNRAVLEVLSR